MKYSICFDSANSIDGKITRVVFATAHDKDTAYELLKYYESQETNTEFYLAKEEE